MTFLEQQISRTSAMVKRWHGRPAKMLELTKSHTALSVVVLGAEYGQNLIISCLSPEYIFGPTHWNDSEITIQTASLASGAEGIELLDEKNGVRITAESFEVKEHVKY